MSEMPKILAAAHAVNEHMEKIAKRIDDTFAKLSKNPEGHQNAPMGFTYEELTVIRGSLDASIKRMGQVYRVGSAPEQPDL